jgi:plastocyanin
MSPPQILKSRFVFAYVHFISATSPTSTTIKNIPSTPTSFPVLAPVSVPVSASTSSTSISRPSSPQTYTVKVGAGGFTFEPQQLNASVGDTVSFEFHPSDHSVAQAAFGSACVPYEQSGKGRVGFWSETQSVSSMPDASVRTTRLCEVTKASCFAADPPQCQNQQYRTGALLLCGAELLHDQPDGRAYKPQ